MEVGLLAVLGGGGGGGVAKPLLLSAIKFCDS